MANDIPSIDVKINAEVDPKKAEAEAEKLRELLQKPKVLIDVYGNPLTYDKVKQETNKTLPNNIKDNATLKNIDKTLSEDSIKEDKENRNQNKVNKETERYQKSVLSILNKRIRNITEPAKFIYEHYKDSSERAFNRDLTTGFMPNMDLDRFLKMRVGLGIHGGMSTKQVDSLVTRLGEMYRNMALRNEYPQELSWIAGTNILDEDPTEFFNKIFDFYAKNKGKESEEIKIQELLKAVGGGDEKQIRRAFDRMLEEREKGDIWLSEQDKKDKDKKRLQSVYQDLVDMQMTEEEQDALLKGKETLNKFAIAFNGLKDSLMAFISPSSIEGLESVDATIKTLKDIQQGLREFSETKFISDEVYVDTVKFFMHIGKLSNIAWETLKYIHDLSPLSFKKVGGSWENVKKAYKEWSSLDEYFKGGKNIDAENKKLILDKKIIAPKEWESIWENRINENPLDIIPRNESGSFRQSDNKPIEIYLHNQTQTPFTATSNSGIILQDVQVVG